MVSVFSSSAIDIASFTYRIARLTAKASKSTGIRLSCKLVNVLASSGIDIAGFTFRIGRL